MARLERAMTWEADVALTFQPSIRLSDSLWTQAMRSDWRRLSWWLRNVLATKPKRMLDVTVALLLLIVLAPAFAAIAVGILCGQMRINRRTRIGHAGSRFDEYTLSGGRWMRGWFGRLPVLVNVLHGDLSLVGPRAIDWAQFDWRTPAAHERLTVRPGLFCLWSVRRLANIDYGSEWESDREYVHTSGFKTDLGIAFRALLASLYGAGCQAVDDAVSILGMPINNLTMTGALDWILTTLDGETSHQLCFVNADCANQAYRDADYLRIIQQAPMVLADGIGLKLAGRLLRREIRQNVNGTDLFPRLCERLAGTGKRMFLLGARPEVVAGVQQWVVRNHPDVIVCGEQDGYFPPEEEPYVLERIRQSQADLLLVALGSPRQDKWIAQNLAKTGVKVAMGVGGLFDFYSGRVPRAPQWLREIGLEWTYRLYCEPRRMWRRYLVGNVLFLWRVLQEKYGRSGLKSFSSVEVR